MAYKPWWETDENFKTEQQKILREWQEEQWKQYEIERQKRETQRAQETAAYRGKVISEHNERMAKGELEDVFLRQHLEAQITAERWKLLIGIALTFLFRYQWVFWILLIIVYFCRVNYLKSEAQKIDQERWKKNHAWLDREE